MDWINTTCTRATRILADSIPAEWRELKQIFLYEGNDLFSSELIGSLSSCKAVGGNADNAVEIAAGLKSIMMSVRILDDLQDRDKPNGLYQTVGPARAFNYSYAYMTLGYNIFSEMNCDGNLKTKILKTFNEGSLITLAGQDRDLQGINTNWEDYWKTAEMKTCYITSTGAAMGAMMGTDKEELINACRIYGYHWGLALQILNDMEGIWEPEGETDLEKGKVTLPVLYAMNCMHDERKELETIVWQGRIAENAIRMKEILDHVDAKSYLIWAALEQRTKALEAISICPDEEGKNAMTYFLNGMFGDIDDLLNNERIIEPLFSKKEIPQRFKTAGNIIPAGTGSYRSMALGLRRNLRTNYN